MSEEPVSCEEKEEKKPNGRMGLWVRLAFFAFILIGLPIVLYKMGWLKVFLKKDEALPLLESLGHWKFVGFILLQAAQVVLAPIPGEVTGIIGGYLFGLYTGVLLSSVGLIAGSYVAFSISKVFGRPAVERFVSRKVIDRFDYLLHHKGIFVAFMLFLLPGFPKDYLCFVLGLGHLSTTQFLVISGVGRLFGTVMLTLSGGFLRYREYEKLLILCLVVLAVTVVAWVFRDKIEKLLKSLHVNDC